jgi:hypothetical protein
MIVKIMKNVKEVFIIEIISLGPQKLNPKQGLH